VDLNESLKALGRDFVDRVVLLEIVACDFNEGLRVLHNKKLHRAHLILSRNLTKNMLRRFINPIPKQRKTHRMLASLLSPRLLV
jgi:hypothetical protein